MALFDQWPYTNLHTLNTDWLVKTVKEVKDKTDTIDQAIDDAEGYSLDAKNAKNAAVNAKIAAESAKDDAVDALDNIQSYTLSLSQQVGINTQDIATQTARIDSIISGTTPDANVELIDIRVRADGETYATAGDAVRGQVTALDRNLYPLNFLYLQESDWEQGSIYSATGINFASTEVIRTKLKHYVEAGTICKVPSGYRYEVLEYLSDGTFVQASNWLYYNTQIELTAGYYRFLLAYYPVADTPTTEYNTILIGSPLYIRLQDIYSFFEVNGTRYDVVGEKINLRKQKFGYKRSTYNLPVPSNIQPGLVSRQDIAVYEGKMFQLYDSDYCSIIDLDDGTVDASYPIDCGHGNSCQFSDEFYSASDDFPLLYCFAYTSNLVYVNRVTTSGATLIRTLKLSNLTGYRFSGAIDTINNRLFVLNYTINSSTTSNPVHLSVLDLNDLTANDDSTYTPALISSIEIPFILMIQGIKYFNDRLFVTSGGTNPSYFRGIQVLDTKSGAILSKVPYTYDSNEPEGCELVDDGTDYLKLILVTNRVFLIALGA